MHDSQRLPCATCAFLKCEGLCGQPTERRFALGQFSQQYPQKSDSIHCINDHDIHFPDVKIISAQLPVDTSILYWYKSSWCMFGPQKSSNGILRLHVIIFLMCGRGAWGSPELLGKQLDQLAYVGMAVWKTHSAQTYMILYWDLFKKTKPSYHTKQLKEFSTTPIWFSMFFFVKHCWMPKHDIFELLQRFRLVQISDRWDFIKGWNCMKIPDVVSMGQRPSTIAFSWDKHL